MEPTIGWLVASAVLGGIVSGLLATAISLAVMGKREQRQFKVDTLKRFAGNRYSLKGDEFTRAMNEIQVVFNDHPEIMTALSAFHESVNQKGPHSNDRLIKLYKSMCDATGISYAAFNDSFFLRPFNTTPESSE